MKWIVEYTDEACGMVRYGTFEVEAESREEALSKAAERLKDDGPGIFATGARPK